jgi:hypothetical protein
MRRCDLRYGPGRVDLPRFELPEVTGQPHREGGIDDVNNAPDPPKPSISATAAASRAASAMDPTLKTAVAPPSNTTLSSTPYATRNPRQPSSLTPDLLRARDPRGPGPRDETGLGGATGTRIRLTTDPTTRQMLFPTKTAQVKLDG